MAFALVFMKGNVNGPTPANISMSVLIVLALILVSTSAQQPKHLFHKSNNVGELHEKFTVAAHLAKSADGGSVLLFFRRISFALFFRHWVVDS